MATRRSFLAATGAAAWVAGARPVLGGTFAQQLTIAAVVPLTGPQSAAGVQIANGVRQAVDEANRLIGTLDRSFAMRAFDDQNSFVGAVMGAQFASADPTVIAAVGHLSGSVTLTALQQYANARMPLIVPASSADRITARGYRNVFRLPTKDSTEGQLFARYLVSKARPTKAVALTQDGDYGGDVARGFAAQAAIERLVTTTIVLAAADPQFSDVARRVLAVEPDFVFLAGNADAMGPVAPALRVAGFKGAFGASQGFYTPAALQYASELADVLISTSMPPLERITADFQYVGDLSAQYGDVTPLLAFGFAAGQIPIDAARRTGVSDRLSLMRALSTGGSYETLLGSFSFSLTGDPIDPNVYFYTLAEGKFKYVGASHPSAFL